MRKSDPLDLLRSVYNKNLQKKTTIKLKGTDLYFDREVKLPIMTETAWQSPQTGKQYNLGSLWLVMEVHSQKIPNKEQYFRQVSALKLDPIGVADAEEIIKYFSGQTNSSTCINNQLKQALLQKTKGRDHSTMGALENEDKVEKKLKTKTETRYDEETTQLLRCLDYFKLYEIQTSSKTQSMRYPQKNFHSILTDMQQKQKQILNNQTKQNNPIAQTKESKYRIQHIFQRKRIPTIIVPQKTVAGNVSIENIQKFLLEGIYDEKAKLSNPEISKIQIQQTLNKKNFLFEIYCRPELLSEKDWQNVVAIFVAGKDNQFDHWAIKDHKLLFENRLGFLVRSAQRTQLGSAAKWNCRILTLDPISRIGDVQLAKIFWADLQNFLFTKVP